MHVNVTLLLLLLLFFFFFSIYGCANPLSRIFFFFSRQDACATAIAALRETNRFLQEEEPWHKKGDEHTPFRLEVVRVCLEAVYGVAHFLVPFLPTACTRIFEKLGRSEVAARDD